MKARAAQTLAAILIVVALFSVLHPLFACAPDIPSATFTRSSFPDPPLENYLRGDLGVLQPTYARSYLYAAYRILIGTGFDPDERSAVVAFLDARRRTPYPSPPERAASQWLEARARVTQMRAPVIHVYGLVEKYYFNYLNCPEDAFRTAAATLHQRTEQFGAGSPEISQWIQGQDAVFANCSGPRTIPAALDAVANAVIQADRAYQIAAANFYSGNFEAAETMFRAIAGDARSPWRRLAPYLVARTLLRRAMLSVERYKIDQALLAQAEEQLRNVLADPALSETHPAAAKLLEFVRFRLRPQERLLELSEAVLKKGVGASLQQDLTDYRMLLDRAQKLKPDDLTDWILTFERQGPEAADHCLQRWKETSSLPWLVASLVKISADHPGAPELLRAAGNIPLESPAYLTVAHHSIRLLVESGRRDDARQRLDQLLASPVQALPASSRNLFLGQRMQVARTFEEFLRFAPRVPVAFGGIETEETLPAQVTGPMKSVADGRGLLDVDATRIFNKRMPLTLLRDASKSPVLPAHLRHQLARAAWVRAALLEQWEVADELVGEVPELKPYPAPNNRFTVAFVLLKLPAMRPYIDSGVGRLTPPDRIDEFRDNWWCRFDLGRGLEVPNLFKLWLKWRKEELGRKPDPDAGLGFPEFLTEAQRAAARQEWARIFSLPAAPNYLSRVVVEWAKAHPADPRVPEALYSAVRSTHLGCTDPESSKWSQAAFQLLHRRYPNSSWAAQTKYWY